MTDWDLIETVLRQSEHQDAGRALQALYRRAVRTNENAAWSVARDLMAVVSALREQIVELEAELKVAVGTPPAVGLPGPGERVQIILDAVRGPLGDRWIVEEPSYRRLIDDGAVAAWRRPVAGEKVKLTLAPMQTAARESE